MVFKSEEFATPAIAQLVEHLTVDHCSNQMVPGSIPGGRTFASADDGHRLNRKDAHAGSRTRVTSMGGVYDAATLHAL